MNENISQDAEFGNVLKEASAAFEPRPGLSKTIRDTVMAQYERPTTGTTGLRSILAGLLAGPRWRAAVIVTPAVGILAAIIALWSFGQSNAFAASVERAAEAIRNSVTTFHSVVKMTSAEGERTLNVWYKQPGFSREELAGGQIVIDDGARAVTIDAATGQAISVGESGLAQKDIGALLSMDSLLGASKSGKIEIKAASSEELDGMECERYEVRFAGPPVAKNTARSAGPALATLWFSKSDGLFRRMERRSGPNLENRAEMVIHYDVEVPDSLFAMPANMAAIAVEVSPRIPELVVTVVDDQGRPAAVATVYEGNFAYFDRYVTGVDGQATIPLEKKIIASHRRYWWQRNDLGQWTSHRLGRDIIVESADGQACDVFRMAWVALVDGQGLVELERSDREPEGKTHYAADRIRATVGLNDQLTYDAATQQLQLLLRLRPKAFVTGRLVDEAGSPFAAGRHFYLTPICYPRANRDLGRLEYGDAAQVSEQKPQPGTVWLDPTPGRLNHTTDDQPFKVPVPAGHPFRLAVAPFGTPSQPTTGLRGTVWPGGDSAREPAEALRPGEIRDIGDIVVPKSTPK